MRKHLWILLALLPLAFAAGAASRATILKNAELSTVVTGTVDIAPDGGVAEYRLDKPEALTQAATDLVGQHVPKWRFEPVLVDGKPARVRAKMYLRLAMRAIDEQNLRLEIRSAHFASLDPASGQDVIGKSITPPKYPPNAIRSGYVGVVYLVMRVGRDGKVEDAVAEQVNLKFYRDQASMDAARRMLSEATLAAAKKWKFTVPAQGPVADQSSWTVRFPVDFSLGESKPTPYGKWDLYIPGPRQAIPWESHQAASGPDASPTGAVTLAGTGPRLLTQLGES
ncbi:energy transducer TonB [Luteimonas aquatica]|uniref:energy transducer TonB n=1 Tax=Luteimonas aquatica TaxID=450364 RepID=UPI001F55D6F0|nr:energy transducer TonB [Luteimonas aquatica]